MTLRPILLGPLLVTLLAGCGGGSDTSSTSGVTVAAAPTATATEPACEVAQAVADTATDSHITKVQVIGGCHMVSIETSYTKADVVAAKKICDAVAAVAYGDNISSVSVDGSDKHELAIGQTGLNDNECIAEP